MTGFVLNKDIAFKILHLYALRWSYNMTAKIMYVL
jgi:hypothetical protein